MAGYGYQPLDVTPALRPFNQLPAEIITKIVGYIRSFDDQVSFGTTNKRIAAIIDRNTDGLPGESFEKIFVRIAAPNIDFMCYPDDDANHSTRHTFGEYENNLTLPELLVDDFKLLLINLTL